MVLFRWHKQSNKSYALLCIIDKVQRVPAMARNSVGTSGNLYVKDNGKQVTTDT